MHWHAAACCGWWGDFSEMKICARSTWKLLPLKCENSLDSNFMLLLLFHIHLVDSCYSAGASRLCIIHKFARLRLLSLQQLSVVRLEVINLRLQEKSEYKTASKCSSSEHENEKIRLKPVQVVGWWRRRRRWGTCNKKSKRIKSKSSNRNSLCRGCYFPIAVLWKNWNCTCNMQRSLCSDCATAKKTDNLICTKAPRPPKLFVCRLIIEYFLWLHFRSSCNNAQLFFFFFSQWERTSSKHTRVRCKRVCNNNDENVHWKIVHKTATQHSI